MASETYSAFVRAAEEYLKNSNSISPESSKSNVDIVRAVKEKIAHGQVIISVTDGTMLNYLSNAANNDDNSQIISGGPRAGYWLGDQKAQQVEKAIDEQTVSSSGNKNVKINERDLYPLMELWLQKKGYNSKDVSNVKRGGKWGNPDIIGVNRIELFGAVQIDLASCEVKLSERDWEQVIFEAISHKRFANRSWFCYRVSSDFRGLTDGIEYYCERYRVGVVQILLSDQDLIDLKNKNKSPLDLIDSVSEIIPAQYDFVPLSEQANLVERTGISLTLSF